jgi:hypothetical protein
MLDSVSDVIEAPKIILARDFPSRVQLFQFFKVIHEGGGWLCWRLLSRSRYGCNREVGCVMGFQNLNSQKEPVGLGHRVKTSFAKQELAQQNAINYLFA